MIRRSSVTRRTSCSTPKKLVTEVPSVSISSITSYSSLSDQQIRRWLRNRVDKGAEVTQKRKKKEQRAVPKKRFKKYVKRKTRKVSKESSSSWETTLASDDEKENVQPANFSPKIPLFENSPSQTPERVREAYYIDDFRLDSPVSRRNKDAASPVKICLEDSVESLPLKHLPSVHPLVYSSDEEDYLVLTRNHNKPPRTYPAVKRLRKPKISVDKSKRWLVDVKCPTVAADMLWDEYVRTHPEEMREYVAPATDQNVASSLESEKNNYGTDKAHEERGDIYRFPGVDKGASNIRYHRMGAHYNRLTKKWTQIKYPEVEDSDSDFGRNEAGSPKMSLNQYLQKRRARRRLASQTAGPSCSKYDEVTDLINRKRKTDNDNNTQDLSISNTETKITPSIRSIKTLKRMKYVRKGSKWFIVRE